MQNSQVHCSDLPSTLDDLQSELPPTNILFCWLGMVKNNTGLLVI